MEAIEKLRSMTSWYNAQSEYINQRVTSVAQLEKVYDYAIKNNLEYIDEDYLLSLPPKVGGWHLRTLNKLIK
jgi:hypothetical protein